MFFLLEYDREKGAIVQLRRFADAERSEAYAARLELEIGQHAKGVDNEVVLLDAMNENDLRKTHRRYFEDIESLARTFADSGNFSV